MKCKKLFSLGIVSMQGYSEIFEHSPLSVVITDNNGIIKECNHSSEKLYGQTKKFLEGKDLNSFSIPDSGVKSVIDLIASTKDKYSETQLAVVNSFGRRIYIKRRVTAVKDKSGILNYAFFDEDLSEKMSTDDLVNLQGAALEAAANAIMITNISGDIVWVNNSFLVLTGYREDEVIYKNAGILNSGKQNRFFFAGLWNTIKSGKVWHGELINQRKDGTFFDEEQTITPVFNRDNEISHFIAIKQDITERKRTLKEIEEASYKFELLAYIINHSPAISFLWKLEGSWPVEFVSDNIKQLGYSPEQFYDEALFYSDIVFPEDKPVISNRIYEAISSGVEYFRHNYRIINSSGTVRWVVDNAFFRTTDTGDVTAYQGVILDITDQKMAEMELVREREFLRTILLSIEDGIIAYTPEGRITLLNKAASEILGLNHEILNIKEVIPLFEFPAIQESNVENPALSTLTGRKLHNTEAIIEKNGIKKYLALDSTRIQNNENNPLITLLVLHDITERKEAEIKSRIHQEQLIQADKMVSLGTLVSGVAHEINNPNNFIMLNVPLLEKTWQSVLPILDTHYESNGDFFVSNRLKYSKIRESIPVLLQGISEGATRIKNIVSDLKDFSRRETSDIDQNIEINDVIKAALSLTTNLLKKSTNFLTINYGTNIPIIKGNFQRLEQVLINLIENSCQALDDKSKSITITSGINTEELFVFVSVEDEGIGIDPKNIKEIVDPFFTTKRDKGGTGLGLAVSSKIIMNHNGTLEFSSEPGKGTKALIKLPVKIED